MMHARIASVRGREILDSRGRPTVEADVALEDGTLGRASVPSGASTGRHEALELRDGDDDRYRGLGVRRAVDNINGEIAAVVVGLDAGGQATVDERMRILDGTVDKERLGANALLAVSLATCRAGALARRQPLYRHIADLRGVEPTIPLPMVNMLSGGLHADGILDIQDILVIPTGAESFADALETIVAIHATLGDRVRAEGHPALVADEGGWAPALDSNETAIAWVAEAIDDNNVDAAIALDVAASHFLDGARGTYVMPTDGAELTRDELIERLAGWVSRYPIVSIEDGLAEDDWPGWTALTQRLPDAQILGDDLFVTDAQRLATGVAHGAGNAVLVKPNQAGTLSEALEVIGTARGAGYRTVVSARSGETEDAFLSDLATGAAAGQIKVGSVTRSSRNAKWNQLLRIEEVLGPRAYVGASALAPFGTGRRDR